MKSPCVYNRGRSISFLDWIKVHIQQFLRWIEILARPSYWAEYNPWKVNFCEICGHHIEDHEVRCFGERKYCGLCGRKSPHWGIYH